MIEFYSKLRLHSPVIGVGEISDGIIFIDSNYRIYKTNKSTKEFIFAKHLFKDTKPHHEYSKAIDANQNLIVMSKSSSNIGIVIKVTQGNTLQVIKSLNWHKGYISASAINSDNTFFATGGEDGRAYVYNTKTYGLHTILPPRSDYISNINFSPSSKFIAYHSFEPKSVIYDIEIGATIATFSTKALIEDSLFFNNEEKIFFVCRNGDTGIYDLVTRKISIKSSYSVWLTSTVPNYDRTYAYIATRSNIFYVHRLSDNKMVYSFELTVHGVCKIKRVHKMVFFCSTDGSVVVLDVLKGLSEFIELCKNGDFTKVYNFANENNVLLKTLKIYEDLRSKTWPSVIEQVVKIVKSDSVEKAINIVAPYTEDAKCDEEFKTVLKSHSLISEALEEIAKKNYAHVYKLAQDVPELKMLSIFKKLEDEFEKTYENAKSLLIKDPEINKSKAEEMLRLFSNIPSKIGIIKDLLDNVSLFAKVDKLAKEMNFRQLFELCEQYDFLKTTKSYNVSFQACSKLYNKTLDEIFKEPQKNEELNFDNSIATLSFLKDLIPFKTQAEELLNLVELKLKLSELIKSKNYVKVYELLDANPSLYNLNEVISFENKINKILNTNIERAYSGNSKVIFDILKNIFGIPRWNARVISTMKIAYLYEIGNAKVNSYDKVDWVATFTNYITIFGKDNEIILVCTDSELRSALNFADVKRVVDSPLVPNIVIYID